MTRNTRHPLDATPLGPQNPDMNEEREFNALEASELFCPTCKTARPVRRHLFLVLPTGSKYEYRCAVCATAVGAKDDSDPTEYQETMRGRKLR